MAKVDEESKQVSYQVVRDENGNVKLECPAIVKCFAAEEISAQFLKLVMVYLRCFQLPVILIWEGKTLTR